MVEEARSGRSESSKWGDSSGKGASAERERAGSTDASLLLNDLSSFLSLWSRSD